LPRFDAVFELLPFLAAVFPLLAVVFAWLVDLCAVFDVVVFLAGARVDFFDAASSAAPYESVDASVKSAAIRKIRSPTDKIKGQALRPVPETAILTAR
jgi:hypothetical protein